MFVTVVGSGHGCKKKYVLIRETYRENGKIKGRTVKNLGPLDDLLAQDPQAIEKLKAQYASERQNRRQAAASSRADVVKAITTPAADSHRPFPLVHYGHYPLRRLWNDLLQLTPKIRSLQKKSTARFDRNAALSFMTFMKVLDPHSVRFSFSDKDSFVGDPAAELTLDNFYSTLDFVHENKDDLFSWINRRMDDHFGRERATLVFYDVTNVYFEAPLTDAEMEYERSDFPDLLLKAAQKAFAEGRLPANCFDEEHELVAENLPETFWDEVADQKIRFLRMRGPSKEHRFDLPLVSVALVIDKNGFPMDFSVYSGNSSEFCTMEQSIESLRRKYDIRDAVVVADRGLNSVENLKMLRGMDLGYLVAQKISQLDRVTNDAMLDLSTYSSCDPERSDATLFKVIPNWKKGSRNNSITCSLVLTYNEKRRKRDLAILDAWCKVIEKKKAEGVKIAPRKFGWSSLAETDGSTEAKIVGVDQNLLEKKKKLCGFAGLVYEDSIDYRDRLDRAGAKADPSSTEPLEAEAIDLDEEGKLRLGSRVASTYSRLNRIEDAFRVMKSNLGLRPMFVRNAVHIQGHIAICVLALLLVRLLQHKLHEAGVRMSVHEMCRSLREASVAVRRGDNGVICFEHVGRIINPRKDAPNLKTEELIEKLKTDSEKTPGIWSIMESCGLSPLPRMCNRHELARCIGTRFGSDEEVLSPIVLHQI